MIWQLAFCLTWIPSLAITSPDDGPAPNRGESAEEPPHRRLAPTQRLSELPVANILVDLKADDGPLDAWRHTLGQGGVNPTPLPDRVISAIAKLRPRLVRIFIQEFFSIYPEHDRFDWSRLDPYMDAFAKTGAKVVAAITIKPEPLFPKIDQRVWRPNDVEEWRRVIAALVKRYSVDKPMVSYWEIGNEPDIGENGGCPYLIEDPKDYAEYYKMTMEPILSAFPEAKVGGSAVANADGDYLPRFVDRCLNDGTRIDFISWHLYSDDPGRHAHLVGRYRKLLDRFPGRRPEMLVTEWQKDFDPISVEDTAFDPRRAAAVGASIVAMADARVDYSFYYHIWDQVWRASDFKRFFQNTDIMYHHWNEVPHRFGLFGVGEEVRPQYFIFQMLGRMGGRRARVQSDTKDLWTLAAMDRGQASLLVVNYGRPTSQDRIAKISFSGLSPGAKQLVAYRIDHSLAWSTRSLELLPEERREVDVEERFFFQVYCPADAVCLAALKDAK